jgi:hypothetical protein
MPSVSRQAAYTLLLGFCRRAGRCCAARAAPRSRAQLPRHNEPRRDDGSDLELRGPSRVGWVESMYFADRGRTMPEIEAALLALNVHGDANRTVPARACDRSLSGFHQGAPANGRLRGPRNWPTGTIGTPRRNTRRSSSPTRSRMRRPNLPSLSICSVPLLPDRLR